MKRGVLCALALMTAVIGCSKKQEKAATDTYVYEPVRIASAYIPLIEKPDATRVLLVGEEARALTNYLSNVGVKCFTTRQGRFDLIIVSCSGMSKKSCGRLCSSLSENGVVAWIMNVEGVTAEEMLENFRGFALNEAHLWMPGERRWLLVGRKTPRKIRLAAMLDVFVRERAFADMAKAKCLSLAELCASYVGTANDVVPAFFNLAKDEKMRPELFLKEEIPAIDWIDGSEMDEDIRKSVMGDIRSYQVVRRLAVKAGMAVASVKNKKDEEAATESFAKVALRNPNELFVLERLDRLDRNARGFLEVGKVLMAMKCYETMVLIRPNDAAAVHNFGMCMKKIGKLDLAEKILKRAESLSKSKEGEPARAKSAAR